MKTTFIIALIFFGFAFSAKAGLLLEPYAGYESGKVLAANQVAYCAGGVCEASSDTSGVVVGARLGYKLPALLWFAADFDMLTGGKSSGKVAGSMTDGNMTRTEYFLDAGVDLPLIRAYAGYGFASNFKVSTTAGDNNFNGNAYKLGLGFTGLPLVAINLEFIKTTVTQVTGASFAAGNDPGTYFAAMEVPRFLLTVSFPFHF